MGSSPASETLGTAFFSPALWGFDSSPSRLRAPVRTCVVSARNCQKCNLHIAGSDLMRPLIFYSGVIFTLFRGIIPVCCNSLTVQSKSNQCYTIRPLQLYTAIKIITASMHANYQVLQYGRGINSDQTCQGHICHGMNSDRTCQARPGYIINPNDNSYALKTSKAMIETTVNNCTNSALWSWSKFCRNRQAAT